MVSVQRVHIRQMRTMNMYNPVLMQSWKQFGKMMITMSFVEVHLTQAEPYHHRSPAFAHYSQLEFECIVQLQEKVQRQEKSRIDKQIFKRLWS